MSKSYSEKLKDPRWLDRREEILERDNHRCFHCHSQEDLEVYHRWYIRNADPWDYPGECLITLCEYCHKTHHLDPSRLIDQPNRPPAEPELLGQILLSMFTGILF